MFIALNVVNGGLGICQLILLGGFFDISIISPGFIQGKVFVVRYFLGVFSCEGKIMFDGYIFLFVPIDSMAFAIKVISDPSAFFGTFT